jgi:hypothetical protein
MDLNKKEHLYEENLKGAVISALPVVFERDEVICVLADRVVSLATSQLRDQSLSQEYPISLIEAPQEVH